MRLCSIYSYASISFNVAVIVNAATWVDDIAAYLANVLTLETKLCQTIQQGGGHRFNWMVQGAYLLLRDKERTARVLNACDGLQRSEFLWCTFKQLCYEERIVHVTTPNGFHRS